MLSQLTLASTLFALALAQGDWLYGRGTFYGNEWWLWDIHQGSCGYGYLCPEEGTGWDVTALPDVHWAYSGSCGRCYEVGCNPAMITDNYGQTLDRSYQCYDPSASVVVTVTDTCPCFYAENYYSNQRWCCGDMDHLDLSIWTFEKLAEPRFGVIALKYREVPCDYKPNKPAPEVASPFPPTPIPEGTVCPTYRFPLKENWQEVQADIRVKAAIYGAGEFANSPALAIQTDGLVEEAAVIQEEADKKPTSQTILSNGVQQGWSASSYNAEAYMVEGSGMNGGTALCAKLYSGGILQLSGSPGFASSMTNMDIWVQQQNENTLAIEFNLGGSLGSHCQPIHVTEFQYGGNNEQGFNKYTASLEGFGKSGDKGFAGCGGVDASQLDSVIFQNVQPYEQSLCFDEISLWG